MITTFWSRPAPSRAADQQTPADVARALLVVHHHKHAVRHADLRRRETDASAAADREHL